MPADQLLRLAVLVSGRGSNLQAIIDAITSGRLEARIVGVFSDRPTAPALDLARAAGLATFTLKPRDFDNRLSFDDALFSRIDDVTPDLIVCAGYMRLISQPQVDARPYRMINIHPSLLPAFKGLHTHQQVLDAGVSEHGASVHVVSAELDGGAVISQARVPVRAGDDADALQARVLPREYPLLVETLGLIASGRLALGDPLQLDGQPMSSPLKLNASDRLESPDTN